MSGNAQNGTFTTTKKLRIYTNYTKYIELTQEIYNEIILKYYNLIFEHLEFLSLSNQNCLRELEKLTIKSKTGEKPENYFDLNVPVYLRRSAINQAIGNARSFESKYQTYLESKEKNPKIKEPTRPTKFNCSIILYKGMYKEFSDTSIKIKLFNGSIWKWYLAKIKQNSFKQKDEILSPTIVINKKYIMLHVPVQQEINDVTPVKQRMEKEHIRVCGIAFSNSDSFAICVILDENKNLIKTKFIKGGNEYRQKTSKILNEIKKHRQSGKNFGEKDHKNYWEKLYQISNYYAHKVSKEIVDLCLENKAEVISIADMNEDINKHFGKIVGKYSPIYLRKRITKYLNYKAFKNGVIITKVRKNYIASKCYICRGNIKRKNLKFECENGHTGDYFFNSAMNIAVMCLKKFGR